MSIENRQTGNRLFTSGIAIAMAVGLVACGKGGPSKPHVPKTYVYDNSADMGHCEDNLSGLYVFAGSNKIHATVLPGAAGYAKVTDPAVLAKFQEADKHKFGIDEGHGDVSVGMGTVACITPTDKADWFTGDHSKYALVLTDLGEQVAQAYAHANIAAGN